MITAQSPTSDISRMLSYSAPSSEKDIMGRDDFLRVLITQLRHQDPIEPMGQEEMIAQLTQFNILDEVRSLNTTLAQGIAQEQDNVSLLVALQQALLNSQSVGLIGREITAYHDRLRVGEGEAPTYTLEAPAGAANVTVTILDANGATARVEQLGPRNGAIEYRPDTGGLSAGSYRIEVEALMTDGTTQTLTPRLQGTVTGVRFLETGTVLEVDGQQVFLSEVTAIVA